MLRFLRYYFLSIPFLFALNPTDSLEKNIKLSWPVDISKAFLISSTFGESRKDHFHNGVDIPGKGINVYPVERGRILWETEAVMRPGDIPFGGGKTIIMDHNGLWSGYMHLMKINPEILTKEIIERETFLGKSGDTGHSGGAHLHFFVYNPQKKRMINPLPYLTEGPYKNITEPKSLGYGVFVQDELITVNPESTFRMSKEYPMYARITDSGSGREKWGIYTLESYTDSDMKNPVQKLVFNYIELEDNRWKTSNDKTFEDVYYEDWINLGSGFKKSKKMIWRAAGYLGPENIQTIDLHIKD